VAVLTVRYSFEGEGVAWGQVFIGDFLFGPEEAVATAGGFIFKAHPKMKASRVRGCLSKIAHLGRPTENRGRRSCRRRCTDPCGVRFPAFRAHLPPPKRVTGDERF
jgi:hypothetical protein